ncbi:PE-PPE domain-containing protein [Candidatus Mycolicibacterium alkanivorans]|uniref:PE-PPE domain-containing protein n=1 Tax=Candidatus Mycolicibacterium alkanivorans TaxID=2954114 RepID=A0ABS9YRG2_9MYCO|nr:PE-PPE domain-containing protein [Candidatus Mycolicibacterium alkanivorans]MCI4673828.1 PE-PPE domain-containing protein [Candidatus Mycolicibacterium alkanivorans]
MRITGRKPVSVLLAFLTAATLGVSALAGSAATWAATTLLLGATFVSDPMANSGYAQGAIDYYVNPTTLCAVQTCATKPVVTPETFWPFTGLADLTIDESITQGTTIINEAINGELTGGTDTIVVFGNSQSSSILTHEKRNLVGLSAQDKGRLTFVLVANPNRPNGGMLERFFPVSSPSLGLTASGATPTDTGIQTVDIAFQYDGVADLPLRPLNLLADLNVLFGAYLHSSYVSSGSGYTPDELVAAINDPANRQVYGDTTYITIPAKRLPLLVPLRDLGQALGLSGLTTPIADLLEPTLRVLVESGYDRSIPYGQPTTFDFHPKIDDPKLITDLQAAGKAGVRAALADIGATPSRPSQSPSNTAVSASNATTSVASTAGKAPSAAIGRSARKTKTDPAPAGASVAPDENATAADKPANHTVAATRRSAQRSTHHSE